MSRRLALTCVLSAAAVSAVLFWSGATRSGPARPGLEDPAPGIALAGEPAGPAPAATASARELSRAFVAAARKARPAVVHIQVERKVPAGAGRDPADLFGDEFFRRFFRGRAPAPRERVQRGQGSGVIMDARGYILTNNHVVGNADVIRVKLAD
ncbi:MAG: serine protease, partial [Planctomycetota bacterium]